MIIASKRSTIYLFIPRCLAALTSQASQKPAVQFCTISSLMFVCLIFVAILAKANVLHQIFFRFTVLHTSLALKLILLHTCMKLYPLLFNFLLSVYNLVEASGYVLVSHCKVL